MELLEPNQLFKINMTDCIPGMNAMPPESVDFSCFSPPFPSIFAYNSSEADMGNIDELDHELKLNFSFFFHAIRRVMKPGRVVMVHCQQIVRMKRSGGQGMVDFRGILIRLGRRAGLIYDYDWLVRKGPQGQAIRTKSHALQFAGLEKDRAQSRGAMGDYLIKFICPGENRVPINSKGEVSRNDWIDLAEGCWDDIRENDTLNFREARSPSDTRHICCLQLKVIERLVRLFSNPGEIVFSPFTGVGSELYQALRLNRRAFGFELKEKYYQTAIKNCERAVHLAAEDSRTLFDSVQEPIAVESVAESGESDWQ